MASAGKYLPTTVMATIVLLALSLPAPAEECRRTVDVSVSAYSLTEQYNSNGKTASGVVPRPGFIAISRDLEREHGLKFGDTVWIKGLGEYIVQDWTHLRKNNSVDIFMESYRKARNFGIRKLKMIIELCNPSD